MGAEIPADLWSRLESASAEIARRTPLQPRIAIVLGSGLGALAGQAEEATVIPYAEIPHFPRSTAPGHAGRLVVGRLAGQPVVLFAGRAHLYEGYDAGDAVFGVRVARRLGAETLIVTNAAGGVNLEWEPGTLM